jgi:hypothetical protein
VDHRKARSAAKTEQGASVIAKRRLGRKNVDQIGETLLAGDFDELTDLIVTRVDEKLAERRTDPECMCVVEFMPPVVEPLPDGTSRLRLEGVYHTCSLHAVPNS